MFFSRQRSLKGCPETTVQWATAVASMEHTRSKKYSRPNKINQQHIITSENAEILDHSPLGTAAAAVDG